jgi:uncharacterized protein YqeY
MQDQLTRDLKAAMLSGDKQKAEVLKGLKNALQYESVGSKSQDKNLSEEVVQKVFTRESKKRHEAAEIYKNAGETTRADVELAEKKIIDGYLPEQLGEEDIKKAVKEEVVKLNASSTADMGKVIGAVRTRLGAQADGATIARLVKEALNT